MARARIEHSKSWITARLEDGALTVTLRGSAEYASTGQEPRTVSFGVDITDESELANLRDELSRLLEEHTELIEDKTYDAAVASYQVMRRVG